MANQRPTRIEAQTLSDGSEFRVEWYGDQSVLIDRYVGGQRVWGQAFGGDNVAQSVERVRANMAQEPTRYDRRRSRPK